MSYRFIVFRVIVLILLIVTFILNYKYNTGITKTLFDSFWGMSCGIIIYDKLKDMED